MRARLCRLSEAAKGTSVNEDNRDGPEPQLGDGHRSK